jgi:predicted solute-binding protein
VVLAQVILARKYGVEPVLIPRAPDIESMLDAADAAVIIGDPAIRVDPGTAAFSVLDLGREWHDLTGLPMVYAVWAGRAEAVNERSGKILRESCRFGIDHLDQVIRTEAARRGFTEQFTRTYLTRNLVNEFGTAEYEGLNLFLEWGVKITTAATASSQQLPPCAAISTA